MKTKDFIKRVEELGFKVKHQITSGIYNISCFDEEDDLSYTCSTVSGDEIYIIKNDFISFATLNEKVKKNLFDLLVEYASTPIEEREEKKKYYLKHKWLAQFTLDRKAFLNFNKTKKSYFLDTFESLIDYQTQFTQKEIDEIKEKFDTDLADFDIVEVEE